MANTQPVVQKLTQVRRELLAVAERVPPELWQKRPPNGGWSVAEVIAHLTMVETAILNGARKLMAAQPKSVPFWKRLHIPIKLAEWRFLRARTPIPLDPALVGEKDAMLERFRALRQQTLAFLEANRDHDLRRWRWPHPFFGSLNGRSWFKILYYHEIRHTKQLREIVRLL